MSYESDAVSKAPSRGKRSQELGARGEEAAALFLERRGFEVVDRNWSCPYGEIDLVALEDGVLHFVEVKTRSNPGRGFPSEAVTAEKRTRYETLAALYLQEREFADVQVTFDIISIVVTGPERAFLRFHANVLLEDCR